MNPQLARPFPNPPKVPYISFATGTILKLGKKKFPRPRALSLIDLRQFAHDKPELSPEDFGSDWSLRRHNSGDDVNFPPVIHKSNSSHTLHLLGRKAELRRVIVLPVDSLERDRFRNTMKKRAEKSKWHSFDESSSEDSVSDDDVSQDEENENLLNDAVNCFILFILALGQAQA